MKPRDIVLEQIHHRETAPVPYTLDFEGDVADRLDAHYGSKAWRDRLTPYLARFGAVDTGGEKPIAENGSMTRDLFGSVWRKDRRPFHLERPGLQKPSFDGYDFPPASRFLDPKNKEWVRRRFEESYADSFRVAGIGWGLFERSWTIRGFENALMDAAAEPDFYAELLDRLTANYLAFVEFAADLPVDAIMFGDDWGDQRGVILGPDRWRRFLKPRWAQIYDAVHRQGKLVISHCCGSVADILPDIIEIGLDVLESVQPEAMNVYDLKRKWGDKIVFWGGLGTQSVIPFGTPAQIRAEVSRLCREMGKGGGYILASAKPLQPETPTANAAAVFEAFTGQTSA